MKRTIISFFLLASVNAFAQTDTLTKEDLVKELQPLKTNIQVLQTENSKLTKKIGVLENQLSKANKSIDSLQIQTQANSNNIAETANELGVKIVATETNTNQRITEVDKSLSKTTLWAIIGILFAVIVSGIVYWLLHRKQQSDKTDIVAQLSQTKQQIDEKLVNEFAKNTEALEALSKVSKPLQTAEPDHSLALKVASEINLIERNINLMDKGIKGLKQLERSIGKLKDNLSANGYEMPELLGKQYHQGMKVIVTSSIPDENLEKGSEVITKVLIPQVNFNDKMIQTAQIEVSVGM